MTLDLLLTEIAEAGFLVNNLFQRDDGSWQANLRTTTHHCEFAIGSTATEALSLCIDLIETAEPFDIQPATFSIETKQSIESILSNLLPKKQPFDRRM